MRRKYLKLFGEPELHSHLRWKGVLPLLDLSASRTLEVGCGEGIMLLELWSRSEDDASFVGIELDSGSVEWGNTILKALNASRVSISRGIAYPLSFGDREFDQVLLIDVLEHLADDLAALREIHRVLQPGGRLVISVPTPTFPIAFGREFADRIGHLRDGYWLEDLQNILEETGFHLKKALYHTGPIASRLCSIWYKSGLGRSEALGALSFPFLRSIALLGEKTRSGPQKNCSLAILAEKPLDADLVPHS